MRSQASYTVLRDARYRFLEDQDRQRWHEQQAVSTVLTAYFNAKMKAFSLSRLTSHRFTESLQYLITRTFERQEVEAITMTEVSNATNSRRRH